MNPWMWTPFKRFTSKTLENSEDLIVEYESLTKDELLTKLKETRLRCIKYEEALKQLEADKQKLEKDKTLLAAELSEEMNKMAGEKNVLVKQLREQITGNRTEADEQLLVLNEEKQVLQHEVDRLKKKIRGLKAAEGKEKSRQDEPDLQHKDELQAEIEKLKEEWAQTRTERDHIKKDYDQMMTDYNHLTKSHDQLKIEVIHLQEQNNQITIVHDQLRREKCELHSSQSKKANSLNQVKGKHNQLQESFSRLNVELVQLQEKNTELESLHKQTLIEREELKQTCSKKTKHLDEMKLKHSQLEESLSQMKLEMIKLQEEYAQVKLSYDKLIKERELLSKEHVQMNQMVASFDSVKAERDNLVSHCTQLKLEVAQLQVVNSQIKEEMTNLREELENYNLTSQSKQMLLNEQLSQSNTQRQLSVIQGSQSSMLPLMEEQVTSIKLENKKLESKLKEIQDQYIVLQKKYKKLQSEYKVKDKKHDEVLQTNLFNPTQPSTKRRLFLTKQDYNSQSSLFGCSGHHELQLQTGDMVTVLGDVNSSGYYSVKFRSQRGLVHQSVLEEMDVNRKIRKRISDQCLCSSSVISTTDISNYDYGPLPPTELTIETVTLNTASLSWKGPDISAVGLSNNYKVEGYQLYVDNFLHTRVKGCYECKGMVEGVDFTQPHKLSVAAYSVDGLRSEKCEVHYIPPETTKILSSAAPQVYKASHKCYTQVKTSFSPVLQFPSEQVNTTDYQVDTPDHQVITTDQQVNTSNSAVYQHAGRVHSKPSKHKTNFI